MSLIAYFLKYRYLDLTRFELAVDPDGAPGSQTRTWALPAGWRDLHRDADSEAADLIVDRVKSAPWLGAQEGYLIREAVCWLVDLGFLEFAIDADVQTNGAPAQGAAVLRVREQAVFLDAGPDAEYRATLTVARREEELRRSIVTDLGVGLAVVGSYETHRLIEDAGPNDIVKIATYHLRTVVGGESLVRWLKDKPNLQVHIVCLGPTSVSSLTEGADSQSLVASLATGIQNFEEVRRNLSRRQRRQVKVRIYGDVEAQSLFRGAILCGADAAGGKPKRVLATTWPYGEYRANYGEILKLEGRSNLAKLIVDYYDHAWRNSVPASFATKREWLGWAFQGVTLEVGTAISVGLLTASTLVINPTLQGDAFYALVGTVPILVAAVARVARQVRRAVGLTRAIRRRRLE